MRLLAFARNVPALASGLSVRQRNHRIFRRVHVFLGGAVPRDVEALLSRDYAPLGFNGIRSPRRASSAAISRALSARQVEASQRCNPDARAESAVLANQIPSRLALYLAHFTHGFHGSGYGIRRYPLPHVASRLALYQQRQHRYIKRNAHHHSHCSLYQSLLHPSV